MRERERKGEKERWIEREINRERDDFPETPCLIVLMRVTCRHRRLGNGLWCEAQRWCPLSTSSELRDLGEVGVGESVRRLASTRGRLGSESQQRGFPFSPGSYNCETYIDERLEAK